LAGFSTKETTGNNEEKETPFSALPFQGASAFAI
jgi:hypothetical protein